jgi:plasmid stabilization system protein ParE
MAREVKWTETAWEDLEEVADYIARVKLYNVVDHIE